MRGECEAWSPEIPLLIDAFPTEIEADGERFLPLVVDEFRWWRKRISRVIWPEDTAFGLLFVPNLITAWQVDLGRLATHPQVTAQKARLLLKKGQPAARERRRQRLSDPEDRTQMLHFVALAEVRLFDSLMSGLIVRDGVFAPGCDPIGKAILP